MELAHWNKSVEYLENIGDLLEGVGAEEVLSVAQAEGTVGVDAFKGSCEVSLGITVSGEGAKAVETVDVGVVDIGACE